MENPRELVNKFEITLEHHKDTQVNVKLKVSELVLIESALLYAIFFGDGSDHDKNIAAGIKSLIRERLLRINPALGTAIPELFSTVQQHKLLDMLVQHLPPTA